MAFSYKSSISFGLVYIPIKLFAAVKNNDIGFNMIDKKTNSRVQYKKTCVDCDDREVRQDEIVKGYEYEKDKYIIFDDNDFEKLKTNKDKTIAIEEFVDLKEIDPIYYDKAYYIVPEGGADKAFALLKDAMEKENKVGIAKTMLGSKETLVAVRVMNGQMILNNMFFYEEIQQNPAKQILSVVSEKELKMATTLIDNLSANFEPEKYKDEYKERLSEAIQTKINGKEIVSLDKGGENKIINLMDALKKSLDLSTKKKAKTKDTDENKVIKMKKAN